MSSSVGTQSHPVHPRPVKVLCMLTSYSQHSPKSFMWEVHFRKYTDEYIVLGPQFLFSPHLTSFAAFYPSFDLMLLLFQSGPLPFRPLFCSILFSLFFVFSHLWSHSLVSPTSQPLPLTFAPFQPYFYLLSSLCTIVPCLPSSTLRVGDKPTER